MSEDLKKKSRLSGKIKTPLLDNGKMSTGRHAAGTADYPEIDLGDGITIQRMVVTPEMAGEWLPLVIERQRNVRKRHVKSIVSDIRDGRWRLTHAAIAFNDGGHVIDGQHRLRAILESGKSIETFVFRGFPEQAYDAIDIGAKRTGADTLKSAEYKNASTLASAALFFARYRDGGCLRLNTNLELSTPAIDELVRDHPGLDEAVQATMTRELRALCGHPGAVAVAYYVLSRVDHDDASFFFDHLGSGADLPNGHQILALRNKFALMRTDVKKTTADDAFFFILKVWNCWRKKATIRIIRRGQNDSYPIPR